MIENSLVVATQGVLMAQYNRHCAAKVSADAGETQATASVIDASAIRRLNGSGLTLPLKLSADGASLEFNCRRYCAILTSRPGAGMPRSSGFACFGALH